MTPADRGCGDVASKERRLGLLCIAAATLTVAALAALLPRRYMVNDDQTITAFLRENTLAPYLEPALSQALGASYAMAPEVPWFGLWLYAVYAATLALGARMLLDLPEGAPTALRRALLTGGLLLATGLAVLPLRITFTTAAISACGVGLVGFAAEALRIAEGRTGRTGRFLGCGLVLAAGLLTRTEGLNAAGVATLPLLLAASWRARRAWRLSSPRVIAAFVAPGLFLFLLGRALPQWRDPDARRYLAFNAECNPLQLRAAFVNLDERAPEILKAAGWDAGRYRRFERWVYLDEEWYTTKRLRALRETGGLPKDLASGAAITHARVSAGYAFPLLAASVVAAAFLPLTGLGRHRALLLGLAHLATFAVAAGMLQRWLRFPARVALPMSLVAALAVWVAARADCPPARWAEAGRILRGRPAASAAAGLALAVAVGFTLSGLAHMAPRRAPAPAERVALEQGLLVRHPALVVVHAQAGWTRDPLKARPRDYPHVSLDWDIFSVPFYRSLALIGCTRGRDLVQRLADDKQAFILSERRFLGDLTRMVEEDAPGARLQALERTGATPADLVLSRVVGPGGGETASKGPSK